MRICKLLLPCLIFFFNATRGQVNVKDSLAMVDLYHSTNGGAWMNNANWLTVQPLGSWYGLSVSGNSVISINLNNNNLNGTLPASLGNLVNLQSLQLDVNRLSGGITSSIGNMVNLQYLSMIQNQLSGSIPASLGNLSSLTWLRLSDNQLSGPVPPSLGNLSNLQYFYLGDNQLSGTIPASLGNLTNLIYLQLYLNQLTGPIPASLGSLPNLQDLELALNQLSGSVPASLGNMPNLTTLTFQNNLLSGPIPASLGNLKLVNLFINYNYFTFAGMELIAQKNILQKLYAPQGIIPVHVSCGKLFVSVGGSPNNNSYRWYNSAGVLQATKVADSTFTPSMPGSYYVVANNAVAVALTLYSDTVNNYASVNAINARICQGQFYTLPSGKKVNLTGTFNDTLKNSSGCGDSLITILNLIVNTLATNNSSVNICGGQSYTLPSGTIVNSQGIYYDTAYSVAGCDSVISVINLSVNNPRKINSSATICLGQNYILPSGRITETTGLYKDTLHTSTGGCDSIITTLVLNVDPSVQQMEENVGLCAGASTVVLNAGNNSNTYSWNTGSTSNAITVSGPGQYSVIVNGTNGCIAYDSFQVVTRNAPIISLDKNIVLCNGQPRVIDAGSGYENYLWNTGSSNRSITIQSTGLYWVTVTDQYQCMGTDSTDVEQTVNPPADFLPSDTAICANADMTIKAANNFRNYSWSTNETSGTIVIHQPGIYSLMVTDFNDCIGTDTIVINKKQCADGLFMPTAFTPDGDGVNDILRPINLNNINLDQFHFSIFNRWGQKVFESTNPSLGWDGKINGSAQPFGTYVWMLDYKFQGGSLTNKRGTVVLIR